LVVTGFEVRLPVIPVVVVDFVVPRGTAPTSSSPCSFSIVGKVKEARRHIPVE
jgi:hypothetical protein